MNANDYTTILKVHHLVMQATFMLQQTVAIAKEPEDMRDDLTRALDAFAFERNIASVEESLTFIKEALYGPPVNIPNE